MAKTKTDLVEVQKVAKVFVEIDVLCGGLDKWTERVYGLTYEGSTIWFNTLRGIVNRSGNPNYNDPVAVFDSRTLLEFIGEPCRYNSMCNRPRDRGDFMTGFVMQLAVTDAGREFDCETTGQGGERVMFELPLSALPAFRQRAARLLAKLWTLEFITVEPEE